MPGFQVSTVYQLRSRAVFKSYLLHFTVVPSSAMLAPPVLVAQAPRHECAITIPDSRQLNSLLPGVNPYTEYSHRRDGSLFFPLPRSHGLDGVQPHQLRCANSIGVEGSFLLDAVLVGWGSGGWVSLFDVVELSNMIQLPSVRSLSGF